MISKTITYTDYNGVERTETFWFNLSRVEIIEMGMKGSVSLYDKIRQVSLTKDVSEIISIFKDIILSSYGEKSPDGKRFMKKDENGNPLSVAFSETEAFSTMYMEFISDAEKASEFVKGILPASFANNQSVSTAN